MHRTASFRRGARARTTRIEVRTQAQAHHTSTPRGLAQSRTRSYAASMKGAQRAEETRKHSRTKQQPNSKLHGHVPLKGLAQKVPIFPKVQKVREGVTSQLRSNGSRNSRSSASYPLPRWPCSSSAPRRARSAERVLRLKSGGNRGSATYICGHQHHCSRVFASAGTRRL